MIVGILTPEAMVYDDTPFHVETGEVLPSHVNSVPMASNLKRGPEDVAPMSTAVLVHDETGSGSSAAATRRGDAETDASESLAHSLRLDQ